MAEDKLEKLFQPISDRLFVILYKIEIIILLLVGFKYLILRTDSPFWNFAVIFTLICLDIIYFLLPFQSLSGKKNRFDEFILYLQYYSYIIAITSFLFVVQSWAGSILYYQLALVAIGMTLFFSIIFVFILNKTNPVLRTNIYRTIIIGLILVLMVFTNSYKESKDKHNKTNRTNSLENIE